MLLMTLGQALATLGIGRGPDREEAQQAPGAAELDQTCRNARRLAHICDRLEPLVDLTVPKHHHHHPEDGAFILPE